MGAPDERLSRASGRHTSSAVVTGGVCGAAAAGTSPTSPRLPIRLPGPRGGGAPLQPAPTWAAGGSSDVPVLLRLAAQNLPLLLMSRRRSGSLLDAGGRSSGNRPLNIVGGRVWVGREWVGEGAYVERRGVKGSAYSSSMECSSPELRLFMYTSPCMLVVASGCQQRWLLQVALTRPITRRGPVCSAPEEGGVYLSGPTPSLCSGTRLCVASSGGGPAYLHCCSCLRPPAPTSCGAASSCY